MRSSQSLPFRLPILRAYHEQMLQNRKVRVICQVAYFSKIARLSAASPKGLPALSWATTESAQHEEREGWLASPLWLRVTYRRGTSTLG